ncbi:YktB family protein [Piscibacillus sp. B03]|uniref:YktB family protein n=1 Tax=Piscibacillus sp. B03 TaxID=3457430 RepID=UPI003FCE806F
MANFTGFTQKDFDVFKIDGLDERMEQLRGRLSPKLEAIATDLEPTASSLTGDEMFVHVAKHARRTKNPPNDTWAALASSKRGYKKLPHFQVGMWETHVFIWFAVIYESPIKSDFAKELKANKDQILSSIPDNFVWSKDHTEPDTISHKEMKNGEFDRLVDRLENVKKAEILCGLTLSRDDVRLKDGDEFIKLCETTLKKLSTLYDLTKTIEYK